MHSVPAPSRHDVTVLLKAWSNGEESALDKLTPLVYAELHRLARRYMAGEHQQHSLQATALLNEAYMRLIDWRNVRWQNRAHFFAVSAQIMRRILVDYARSRKNQKRGGDACRVALDEAFVFTKEKSPDLVALDSALQRLAELDERKSKVVELRFFGGLSVGEAAEVLKVSPFTVHRDWRLAKAWLHRELSQDGIHGS
jgi:RNA polymerase sigma factor (TIGR02999 family)